jgi:large subunit ribosomal protein L4
MTTIDVHNQDNEKVSTFDLDDSVFGAEVKGHLLHTIVRYQLAKRRQGTHSVKNRAEVRGGGKKPFRQKGTGRARAGTIRSPIWRGGGTVFGPTPRSYAFKLNKKVRRAALASALSKRVEDNSLIVLDKIEFSEIKTKQVIGFMKTFGLEDMLLVCSSDEKVQKSARNLPGVTVLPPEGVNVYDVLLRSNLVMTEDAVKAITERMGN